MTTDLARMRVAVSLPLALAPKPGGVMMQMKYRVGEQPEQEEKLLLVPASSLADTQGAANQGGKAEALYVFQLSAADVSKLNALRANVGAAKARHEKGSLSFGIETREFCKLADVPAGPVLTTTSVLTSETAGYVTLSRDFDLRSEPKIAADLASLERCK